METCIQPVATINETLPEEILRPIFNDYFEPQESFQFRAVCLYWNGLRSGLFRDKTSIAMFESISRMATGAKLSVFSLSTRLTIHQLIFHPSWRDCPPNRQP